jgi:hypothetical protein
LPGPVLFVAGQLTAYRKKKVPQIQAAEFLPVKRHTAGLPAGNKRPEPGQTHPPRPDRLYQTSGQSAKPVKKRD